VIQRHSAAILFFFLFSGLSLHAADSLFVRQISTIGNKKTRGWVIRREIAFQPGQWVKTGDTAALARVSRDQLNRTALFNTVIIAELTTGDTMDVVAEVSERWYIIPQPEFALADRNFNAWLEDPTLYRTTYGAELDLNNFTGRADALDLYFIFGWRQILGFQYAMPYANRKKTLGYAVKVLHSTGNELGYTTTENKLRYFRYDAERLIRQVSAGLTITYKPAFVTTHSFALNYIFTGIADTVRKLNPDYLPGGKIYKALYPSYLLSIDRRNAITYPTSGSLIRLSAGYTIPVNSGKAFPDAGLLIHYFKPLPRRFDFATGLQMHWQPSQAYAYSLRLPLGYDYYVRGYEHYVMEGNAWFLYRAEMRNRIFNRILHLDVIPFKQFNTIPLQLYIKAFYDAGYMQYPYALLENTLANIWLKGWGAGLDFVTYYDKSLRIEYSFNQLGQSELFLHYDEAF
jgi:outer membrane protein assembly factor BamA